MFGTGGKACHLLELQPAIEELVALDISEPRLQRVIENTERLDLQLTPLVADASALPDTLLATPFDAILADVPCSATGVMRRNPDIKILREPDDIPGAFKLVDPQGHGRSMASSKGDLLCGVVIISAQRGV